jgi:hypothetical protein
MKKMFRALSFTVFVFGFSGWVYIAQNAVHHPETLRLPLTHLLPFPREDTFGIVCFALSFLALFTYMYLKEDDSIKP